MSGKRAAELLKVKPHQPYEFFTDDQLAQSIADRFEAKVRRYGDRLAVRSEKVSYTYNQLNDLANRLANRILRIRGDAAEAVALMFEHDAGVLAAMLGVLKTGKFYVVLDPDYPKDRLQYMLADSGAELVVTDSLSLPLVADLTAGADTIIDFDKLEPSPTDENPGLKITPDALAMLLYTSGSTGQPKGVMHSHRNVLVETRNLTNAWGIGHQDRWLLYTSMSFANSVRTIYGGFLNGSAIYPYDLKKKGFGPLASWLNANQITIMRSLPTTFRGFMAGLPPAEKFPAMRILSVGGEPMPVTDLEYFHRHFSPSCVLVHGLGPTECFMVAWTYIPQGVRVDGSKLPIGYSLPDKDVLLLDEGGREVAPGEIGEICVRSRYISLGYWRDRERTQAVFRADGSGVQIYRTGDLGTRDHGGCLTHVGRADFQMKIRGFRIEAAEIEAALRGIDGIVDAVVVGREDRSGELRLVAYFIPTLGRALTVSEIRRQLAPVIPDYMVPTAFVTLTEFPKTPNGKIDRRALPAVSTERPALDVPFAPPVTSTEKQLAAIWSEVLGLSTVGLHDNFLELGGDSLVAGRVMNRILRDFDLEMPISALFEAPTVAQLARRIDPE